MALPELRRGLETESTVMLPSVPVTPARLRLTGEAGSVDASAAVTLTCLPLGERMPKPRGEGVYGAPESEEEERLRKSGGAKGAPVPLDDRRPDAPVGVVELEKPGAAPAILRASERARSFHGIGGRRAAAAWLLLLAMLPASVNSAALACDCTLAKLGSISKLCCSLRCRAAALALDRVQEAGERLVLLSGIRSLLVGGVVAREAIWKPDSDDDSSPPCDEMAGVIEDGVHGDMRPDQG